MPSSSLASSQRGIRHLVAHSSPRLGRRLLRCRLSSVVETSKTDTMPVADRRVVLQRLCRWCLVRRPRVYARAGLVAGDYLSGGQTRLTTGDLRHMVPATRCRRVARTRLSGASPRMFGRHVRRLLLGHRLLIVPTCCISGHTLSWKTSRLMTAQASWCDKHRCSRIFLVNINIFVTLFCS